MGCQNGTFNEETEDKQNNLNEDTEHNQSIVTVVQNLEVLN